tara:strand:- start:188 stop:472 length:285 start_codon:yes stop_codon:yes gene_type:complete
MINLINKDGSLKHHDFFLIKGHDYKLKIIGTYNIHTLEGTLQVVDGIKNLGTGKVTEMTRIKLSTFGPYIPIEDKKVEASKVKKTNNQNKIKLC